MEYKSEIINFEKEDAESKKRMLGSDKVNIEEIKKRRQDYLDSISNYVESEHEAKKDLFLYFAEQDISYLLSIIEEQKGEISKKDAAILSWMEREDKLKLSFDKLESKQLADQKAIIEQAEKAIEQLGKMDDPDKIEKFAKQALKSIQGDE